MQLAVHTMQVDNVHIYELWHAYCLMRLIGSSKSGFDRRYICDFLECVYIMLKWVTHGDSPSEWGIFFLKANE